MLKKDFYNYFKTLLIVFAIFSLNFYSYAQRASSVTERNKDVHEINELYNKGRWEQGKEKAEKSLKTNPKDADMRMMLGKYYLHKKLYDKARYELVKSLEYAPANVDAKHMLVTVETDTERFSSAICYINELLEVNPYWKGLWRQKIELYRIMGNNVEADRLLKRISQIYPEDNELKKDQSYILQQHEQNARKQGRIDETIEIAKKRINEEPRQPDSYFSIIDNYIKSGDYNNALVYTERGLNEFPNSPSFVQKKIAILENQLRYAELLAFMDSQIKSGNSNLRSQYNYFLLEAARNAKNNDPVTLYGKIFDSSPGNKEAFEYVFSSQIAKEQYEEAIVSLNRHRQSVGTNKELDMKELTTYKRMNNTSKVNSLTSYYFSKYPEDSDLQESFVTIKLEQAKSNMQDGKTQLAITDWKDVIQFGDQESIEIAQRGIYNAYVSEKRYQEAIITLDDMLLDNPNDLELKLKKSDLYNKEGRYDYAMTLYEQVIGAAEQQERDRLLIGYGEMVQAHVKSLINNYRLQEARTLCDRWLTIDPRNQEALLYMINVCYQVKDNEAMLRYAQIAQETYHDDVSFKIKLAEAMNHNPDKQGDSWSLLHNQVKLNPFHTPLINTFSQTTEEYASQLLKNKDHLYALQIIDTALLYKTNYKPLLYMKGLAFEGLKKYDSAYYYQRYFEPSLLEFDEFRSHLNSLGQRSYKNNIGVSHLRARFGDDYAISSVSSVEYGRRMNKGAYIARINYAGRDDGKGIQGQIEWSMPWTKKLSSRIDLAVSNKYFSKLAINGAALYNLKDDWELEAGLGMRIFHEEQNLFNLAAGAVKEIDDFRLSAKLNAFALDYKGELSFLYNLGTKAQYFINSNPKNYVLALGSIGNSPDVELLDYQFYYSFNVFNAMVGAGYGHSFNKNLSANIIGTWYNFESERYINLKQYRNFYNLYFQFNVSF